MSSTEVRGRGAVVALLACAAVPVASVLPELLPGVSTVAVVAAVTAIAVEGVLIGARTEALRLGSVAWLRFRAAEGLVMFVVARIVTLAGVPAGDLRALVRGWWRSPQTVVDLQTVLVFVGLVAVWVIAVRSVEDVGVASRTGRAVPGTHPLRRITVRFLIVGAIAAASLAVHLREATDVAAIPTLGLLVYLVGGLAGIAAIRLLNLRARWTADRVEPSADIGARWRAQSAIFVSAAIGIALLLPVPGAGFGGLAVGYVQRFGRALASYISALRARARTRDEGLEPPAREPEPPGPVDDLLATPHPEPVAGPPPEPSEWLVAATPFIVWGLVAGLVGWAFVVYMRNRPQVVDELRTTLSTRGLRALLRTIGSWSPFVTARRLWRTLLRAVRMRRPLRPTSHPTHGRHRSHWRRGGEMERARRDIVAAYLGVLDEAATAGVPRRLSDTPYEYEEVLSPALPGAHVELDRLTEAFVDARYSTHEIDDALVARARRDADRVLAAIATRQNPAEPS